MSGKCPKCGNVVTSPRVYAVDAMDGLTKTWKAATFACPSCDTILGVAFDQTVHSQWVVDEIVKKLEG